ncbi:MAG: DNA mismatch endonuclease Vsr [Pseudomonadota bacterium]
MTFERSRIMRAVKSRDTQPEKFVRRLAHALGFRFRLHRKDLPGNPDLVFIRQRKVIFVHGCFWHGHGCARGARVPKTNTDYWTAKVARNRKRDRKVATLLKNAGWKRLVIWECQTKNPEAVRAWIEAFLRN